VDPISLLIGAMVLSGFLVKVVQNGRTDRAYAAQGMVSPRHQARLARLEGAGIAPRVAGEHSGAARAYFANVWADAWLDADERRKAKRAARGPVTYDPDRPKWHQRVDNYVNGKLAALRGSYDRLAEQHRAEQKQPDPAVDDLPPGSWTVGPDGEPVRLTEPEAEQETEKEEVMADGEGHQGEQPYTSADVPRPGKPAGGATRTTGNGATAGQAAEVNTNEDARRAFQAMDKAAARLAEAAALAESARAELAALATAGADGMAAKAFDAAATQAAVEAVDTVSLGTLSDWSAAADACGAAARRGLASLDKYRDSEDLVATEQVDPTTLAATSS
jgi:hypothetical protein